ncbi:uncharacterized protein LOC127585898 [Pristis pectinata]|uniref:uncharacterized protein LOC127585898 n=1 Tax=Pristis pectinata TaxID=685728 RepID=UPI00223D96D4|nr:uncharacterized protein LOC127585898 [Pristis pectinata]
MLGLIQLVLLCGGVSAGSHSLRYFYMAVTPVPGVPEFVTVGYVDEEPIVYYDSELGRKVPRQRWMEESQGPKYWERETQISRSNEQVYKVNIQILQERTNQTGGIHTLQKMFGCELREDGSTAGFFQYGWDGMDFLSFDKEQGVWVTPVPWGLLTKVKWDRDTAWNQQVKGYLEQTCIEWLQKYVRAGERDLQPDRPEVYFTTSRNNHRLTCMATGFYPQSIEVTLLRDGQVLEETSSHGILPNHDGTYLLTRSVQVDPTDTAVFTCRVEHQGLPEPLILLRDLPEPIPQLHGSHSLRYFYTGVTPVPGVPEFVTVGYVDEEPIVYYDSELGRKVPRQRWMEESQGPEYWERETQISRSNEQVYKGNIQILQERTNQTGGIHTLQKMFGCELREDGSTAGFFQYGWDGTDFLSFDKEQGVWVTPVPWGLLTKVKWDRDTAWNQQVKGYLEQTCIEWLQKYVRAGERDLQPDRPEVSFTSSRDNSRLSCVATGFYPQSIEVTLLQDGLILEDTSSHGILPNHDGTYQLTRSVKVDSTDTAQFSCLVEHQGLPEPLILHHATDKGESSSSSSATA